MKMITLKNVLLLNAVSSGVTGLILAALSGTVASLFEVTQALPFLSVGLFLVFFAVLVFYAATRQVVNSPLVWSIVLLDSLWVVSSLLIVSLQLFVISFLGYLLISGVAAWVALMAFLQYSGLRKVLQNHPDQRLA